MLDGSTWMGDRLGTLGVVGPFFFRLFAYKIRTLNTFFWEMTQFSALFWRLLRFTIDRLPYKREETVKKRLLKFTSCGCKFIMGRIRFIMGEVGWGWGHVKSKNPLSMEVSYGKSKICYGRTWNRSRFVITKQLVSLNTGKISKSQKVRGRHRRAFK